MIRLIDCAHLPTQYGHFTIYVFESSRDGVEHVALVKGKIEGTRHLLVRVHSECLTAEVFKSLRCDCGEQLTSSLKAIENEGKGLFIYLRHQEGRGIGLGQKIRAYHLQDQGLDTVEANVALGLPIDSRNYDSACQILKHFQIISIRLMTNNPLKINALVDSGIIVEERIAMAVNSEGSHSYLKTKREKMGHIY